MLKRILKSFEYETCRERANIYMGLSLPPLVVTSAIYFGVLKGKPFEEPLWMTAVKLGTSLAVNIPIALPEFGIGMFLGYFSANKLKDKRLKEESKLEKTLN